MVSSRILLLATILLAVASVRASGQDLPPPPATAPAPSACGGDHCSLDDVVKLDVCVDLQLGRMGLANKDRCCRQIRGMPNAADCLSVAFSRADLRIRFNIGNHVNAVLTACGVAHVLDHACIELGPRPRW
ncbi:cortical cell-delineating protein-like [Aegilops tauschii subsp. strangulata]|uniref:cortical cell-delineating protein-like n=1 Tax=Aegilops tauschii subsp. strangulata TaxID=200361 RepID=UPI000989D5FA